MLLSLLAIIGTLFLITSNALSFDSSVNVARHQHIAARHSAVKRAPVSARCKKRATSSTPHATTSAPQAHSPSKAPEPSPSPSPSSGSGKVCLGWAYGDEPSLKNFITPKVSVIYSWNAEKPQNTYGLNYVPMLWGAGALLTQFENLVKPGYANQALSFNEPDLASQSNLDPTTAAQIWMANGQPLRDQGYATIAPAMAFSTSWLQEFFAACKGCEWNAIAAHIYTTEASKMISYITELHETFNMDIWVTEFACQSFTGESQCDENEVMTFMTTVTKWMDETEWIKQYCAYGLMTAAEININPLNALMNSDGTPTELGKIFIGVQ